MMHPAIASVPLRRVIATSRATTGLRTFATVLEKPIQPISLFNQDDNHWKNKSNGSRIRSRASIQGFHSTSASFEPAKRDYYEILGASRSDSKKELKKKYRKLVKEHHPDQNAGDSAAAERYREIVEANEILQDDEKRQIYDQYGHAGLDGGMGDGGFGGFGGAGGMSMEDMMNIFGNFGGFGSQQRRGHDKPRGADLQLRVRISFMEAVHGVHKEIRYHADTKCSSCDATGAENGSVETETCGQCQGKGYVVVQGMGGSMFMCNSCGGQGVRLKNPCGTCHGSGVTEQLRDHGIDIPPGVRDGQSMRVPHGGGDGERGGPAGSLYLHIEVSPDPYFVRDNQNIHTEVPISVSKALLGGEVPVATLDGEVEVKVKPGTVHGTVVRMKGKGIKEPHVPVKGDQFVKFVVEFPKELTERQKELIAEFDQEEADKAGNCDSKVKKLVADAVSRVKSYMSGH